MSTEEIKNEPTSRFDKPVKQWIKAIVWCLIYILFIVWVGTYWWLVGLPVVFDAFVTKYIPWTWWKESKNKTVLTVMGWVDAIVFALVAVYFINTFLFQNYQIPTSSLEKTLLVGDFLFVSKASYGPRVPNTPLSFPLVQHTFPVLNCKSYLQSPQWDYKRLKGFDTIEHNDIVVFNFPAGDTVALNRITEDYEGVCYETGKNQLQLNGENLASLRANGVDVRSMCLSAGRKIVNGDKATYGEIVYRPVDRRENYVKRCVGLPGDFLQVKDRELYINGEKTVRPRGVQHYCRILSSQPFNQRIYDQLKISNENSAGAFIGNDTTGNYVYILPLTLSDQEELKKMSFVKLVSEQNLSSLMQNQEMTTYPSGYSSKWTVDNYGPIWIPKAGRKLKLDVKTLPIYERIIRVYEHNKLEVRGSDIYINDKLATTYQFKMDYYWMMGDNRHNSADSRFWGFVPEDHIVGRPVMVWLSLDKDKGWFSGKIRWNRFFKNAEQ